jgi:hypothetical protein
MNDSLATQPRPVLAWAMHDAEHNKQSLGAV